MIRIACSDQKLLSSFCELVPDSKPVVIRVDQLCERLSEADLFLVTDSEAAEIARNCRSDLTPTLVCLAQEGEPLPSAYLDGVVDDLLTLPLRPLDADRVVGMHHQIQSLRAVEHASRGLPSLVKRLQEDIQLAQKVQRRLIKEKFPAIGGLGIKSKYWCGLKAGGDFFDVFEFPDGNHVGILMADSSSYTLSTNFIGSLMQFSVHVTQDDLTDPSRIVRALFGKVKEGMKEKDRFTIFYGILDRKTYKLRFVDCGGICAGHISPTRGFEWITKGEGAPLTLSQTAIPPSQEIGLEPGDRMMLISDGWAESLAAPLPSLLQEFFHGGEDPQELLNSMAFRLRKSVEKLYELDPNEEEDFPMPPQDCSVMLFEIAKNTLRLAK